MNEKFAEVLGIMAGDGCLSNYHNRYIVYISGHKVDDCEYHKRTTKALFKDVFNKKIKIYFRKDEQTLIIRFSDKKIFRKLAEYLPIGNKYDKLKVPQEIIRNKKYFFAFMRGLIDTDGSIIFSKQHRKYYYYPRIEVASKSRSLLDTLLSELKNKGFYGSVSHKGKYYRFELPGNKNLNRWLENIGFNNRKHIKKIKSHQ